MRECLLVALLDLLSTCVKIMGFFFFSKNRQQQQEYKPLYHPSPWSIKEKQEFRLSPTFDETTAAANAHTCLHKTVEESATQKKKPETDLHHIFQADSVQEFEWIGEWVLLPVLTKSNSIGAQYVTLQMKIRWRKVKICRFVPAKLFCAQQFSTVCWGSSKAQQRLTLAREECNKDCCRCMIWSIMMIGPGGFAIGSLSPICNPSFSFDGWD
jgi:hypothetical protein